LTCKCFSQTQDAQLWENITLSKKLTGTTAIGVNHEGRFANNISQFHYAYLDFGFFKYFGKHFKTALDYVLVWKVVEDRESWRHQWYVALSYKTKLEKRIPFDFREEYQQQYQDIYSSDLGRYPENYFRSKLTISYDFKHFPFYKFKPYVASEVYYHLDNNNKYGRGFDRIRYFIGNFYSFNKKTQLELYYMIEDNFNINNPPVNFVMGIGFEREF